MGGTWQQVESSVEDGALLSELALVYAGRVLKKKTVEASGEFVIQSIIEAVKSEQYLPGFARQREHDIELWKIYVELGRDENVQSHNE